MPGLSATIASTYRSHIFNPYASFLYLNGLQPGHYSSLDVVWQVRPNRCDLGKLRG